MIVIMAELFISHVAIGLNQNHKIFEPNTYFFLITILVGVLAHF